MLVSGDIGIKPATQCPEVGSSSTLEGGKSLMPKRITRIPGIGLIMALTSGVFFATGSLTVKLIHSISGIEIAVIRSLITMIAFAFVVVICKHDLRSVPNERFALVMRCLVGCIALLFTYTSIKLIPLGDSQSIIFSSPVFVNFFACLFLDEPCGLIQYLPIFLAMVGVFLISKPSIIFPVQDDYLYPETQTLGTLLAFGACICVAATFICIRKLRKTSSSVVIFWHSLVTVILGTVILLINGQLALPSGSMDYILLTVCGLTGIIGQALMTLSLKLENAGPVSLARTMDIVMAFIYQVTILKETVTWTSLAGAFILGLGVITVGLNKWYQSDPDNFKRIFLCHCSDSKSEKYQASSNGESKSKLATSGSTDAVKSLRPIESTNSIVI